MEATHYIIPIKAIERLEEARKDLWAIAGDSPETIIKFEHVSSRIYHISQRRWPTVDISNQDLLK